MSRDEVRKAAQVMIAWADSQNHDEGASQGVDPYRELKEAHASGKVILVFQLDGVWRELPFPSWNAPVDRYRIKPDPRRFWLRSGEVYGWPIEGSIEVVEVLK